MSPKGFRLCFFSSFFRPSIPYNFAFAQQLHFQCFAKCMVLRPKMLHFAGQYAWFCGAICCILQNDIHYLAFYLRPV